MHITNTVKACLTILNQSVFRDCFKGLQQWNANLNAFLLHYHLFCVSIILVYPYCK